MTSQLRAASIPSLSHQTLLSCKTVHSCRGAASYSTLCTYKPNRRLSRTLCRFAFPSTLTCISTARHHCVRDVIAYYLTRQVPTESLITAVCFKRRLSVQPLSISSIDQDAFPLKTRTTHYNKQSSCLALLKSTPRSSTRALRKTSLSSSTTQLR